jgi:hypothetical protein
MEFNLNIITQIKNHIETKISKTLEVDSRRLLIIEIVLIIRVLIINTIKSKRDIYHLEDEINFTLPSYENDATKFINKSTNVYYLNQIPIKGRTLNKIIFIIVYLLVQKLISKNKRFYQIFLPYYYYLQVKSIDIKNIHFHYYSFVPEISALSELLNSDKDIYLTYHTYTNFIDESLSVKANTIVVSNPTVLDYNLNIKRIFSAEKYECVRNSEYFLKKFENNNNIENDIIFFSSGFYERIKNSKINSAILIEGINSEETILNILIKFTELNKSVNVYLLPHYARNIETDTNAEIQFKWLLKKKNFFLLRKGDLDTNKTLHLKYNLGITVCSNVFWERLEAGKKTIIFNPPICKDYILNTSLKNLTIFDTNNVNNIINNFLKMKNTDYINKLYND